MSALWSKRKIRLKALLNSDEDEDAEGLALDRILHGQNVIGRTSKTVQIDTLRFNNDDLDVVGTLEFGQFGTIDVVTCKLNGRNYVRKSIEKRFAARTRDQCSPQLERDILLRALKSDTPWAPHLLCAFQTPTHLNMVMDYAEGGTLWDVLESSPHDGRIMEADLKWWTPQIISAIDWCHSQGFVHRDIKPHNFVLSPNSRVLLIDFGSAAPLLPPHPDGSQQVPKRCCLVPCGTCDYISPEILQAHEEALVALEMDDDTQVTHLHDDNDVGGYGRETDWWSMGAMLYEMAYGVAPFFARDIKQTYVRIMDHYRSLKFDKKVCVSKYLKDLLRRLLTTAELRLGRGSVHDIRDHPFFGQTDWTTLLSQPAPSNLHLPQFTYSTPMAPSGDSRTSSPSDHSDSRPFAFSALFQSSASISPGVSVLHPTPSQKSCRSILREQPVASFIGFSWGPTKDIFKHPEHSPFKHTNSHQANGIKTPRPLRLLSVPSTPYALVPPSNVQVTPRPSRYPFATPIRSSTMTPYQTLPRASTVRRTAPRRAVSDREAMKQLVNCVGMSARKKVLESGRKPRILTSFNRSRSLGLKELRFDTSVVVVNAVGVSYKVDAVSESGMGTSTSGSAALPELDANTATESDSEADTDIPPSPSPSPRPNSALSMMSRRSQTPTITSFLRAENGSIRRAEDSRGLMPSPVIDSKAGWHVEAVQITVPSERISYNTLDELQERHTKLMDNIARIAGRLSQISVRLNDGTDEPRIIGHAISA